MKEIKNENVIVMGVGNILLKDEGVGVKVIEELTKLDMPENVELVDGATLGLDLLPVIERADRLIIIDVVKTGSEPGTIFKFTPRDVETPHEPGRMSLHQISLLEVLAMAEMLGNKAPQTVIFGIEPKEIDWGRELSPEISEKIPALIELVIEEIARSQAPE
jgi:hydrogenase maturation protease